MAASARFDPWAPPRPFPVFAWLAERFPFRVPHPQPSTRPLTNEERRDLELRLLVSALPLWLQALLFPTLRWEARRRAPWGQDRCAAGSMLMAGRRFPEDSLASDGAALLRSLLVSECEIGLTTVQTPLEWLSRPERNHALAMRAVRLGQLFEALARSPEAEPLEQEAERALAALRR
jgi:hypothetical protein